MDALAKKNNLEFSEFELELKKFALENNVPIIIDEGLSFLEAIIKIAKPKKILEIGTAIAYSAIRMNKACDSEIYTIERNENMYRLAVENVKRVNKEDKIHILFKDALEAYPLVEGNEFDLIFIDAAKAQYLKFFNLYTPLLSSDGIVVCDNMYFHGLVDDKDNYQNQSRSVRGLIRKLNNFHDELLNNPNYQTSIYNIGDGMAISLKK